MFVRSKVPYDIRFMFGAKTYVMRPGEIKEMPDSFRGLHNAVLKEVDIKTQHIIVPFNKNESTKIYTSSINEIQEMQRFDKK